MKELSKKLYFKNKITYIQGNIKETWKIINQIVKIRSKGSITPDKINNNGVEFDQPQDIANQFTHLEIHACNNPSPVLKRCILSAVASTSSQGGGGGGEVR